MECLKNFIIDLDDNILLDTGASLKTSLLVSFLAGQRPTNWGHHLYLSKMEGDLSHDRQTYVQYT